MNTATPCGSQPHYDVVVEADTPLPLRDGIRLATDLYRPARDGQALPGPFPLVLLRTPYDKRGQAATGAYYAARGYVAAMQDVRGRFASEGEFYAFAGEGPDGYDTVEWLADQPWCNGRVGTLGQSYEAAAQSALASLAPPHLAAMIVTFGPSSYFHSSMRHNGALELRFYAYALSMAASSREALADPALRAEFEAAAADIWGWVAAPPIAPGSSVLRLLPSYERWCLDLLRHTTYDDTWRQPGYGPRPYYDQHADVPTLYIGGWYDTYTRGTAENYLALSGRQRTPVRLLLGPWHHGGVGVAEAGDVSFLPDGGLADHEATRLQWFDRCLKDLPVDPAADPPVRYFVMGGGPGLRADRTIHHGGIWHSSAQWPPTGTTPVPYYLHADGRLSREEPAHDIAPSRYTFDPSNPVPTIGGQLSAMPIPAGGFDQRQDARFPFTHGSAPLCERPDVLCFQTEPLGADVTVVGPITARLWVATDGPDTDFTAKLIDVYPPSDGWPDGCALNLTDSIGRLRFREGLEHERPAEPGRVYALSFELYPTANRFVAGHRIRVDISSSNFPRFDPNPNTGAPLGVAQRLRVAQNCLYHDGDRPSHLVLSLQTA